MNIAQQKVKTNYLRYNVYALFVKVNVLHNIISYSLSNYIWPMSRTYFQVKRVQQKRQDFETQIMKVSYGVEIRMFIFYHSYQNRHTSSTSPVGYKQNFLCLIIPQKLFRSFST